MAVTLHIDTKFDQRLAVSISPLSELACALHAVLEPDHHPLSARWLQSVAESENGRFLAETKRWWPLLGAFKARYLTPLDVDSEIDIHSEIERIGRLTLHEFTAMSAQAMVGQNSYLPRTVTGISTWKPNDFQQRMNRFTTRHQDLGTWLLAEPSQVRSALISFLHTIAAGPFLHEWEMISGTLERQRMLLLNLIHKDPWEAFERIPVTRVDRDRSTVTLDKIYQTHMSLSTSPVLLVPTFHARPHIPIKHYPGLPIVICTPVNPDGDDAEDDFEQVTKRLSALNNAARLSICRTLIRESMSTTEVAQQKNMSPQQVSRHLRKLREAGLIVPRRHGAEVRYHLDTPTMHRLGNDIISILRL